MAAKDRAGMSIFPHRDDPEKRTHDQIRLLSISIRAQVPVNSSKTRTFASNDCDAATKIQTGLLLCDSRLLRQQLEVDSESSVEARVDEPARRPNCKVAIKATTRCAEILNLKRELRSTEKKKGELRHCALGRGKGRTTKRMGIGARACLIQRLNETIVNVLKCPGLQVFRISSMTTHTLRAFLFGLRIDRKMVSSVSAMIQHDPRSGSSVTGLRIGLDTLALEEVVACDACDDRVLLDLMIASSPRAMPGQTADQNGQAQVFLPWFLQVFANL
ncbi:hypothetical protein EDB83DRAFT_2321363 [Lactarius deliciosus]|nr:hypothetical protein EDB83DRAFT_2321363 [Lactarius deliciosus]